MHAQYFSLLNLILQLQFCGEACLEFPLFNFPNLVETWLTEASSIVCYDSALPGYLKTLLALMNVTQI